MEKRISGKFLGILTILVMLCMALGGTLMPGTAYAQGTWNVMTTPPLWPLSCLGQLRQ